MAALARTCEICETEFYGRADATYCTTACRQKAYRQRNRNASSVTAAVSSGPVPIGDAWMQDRFGGGYGNDYTSLAVMTEFIIANYKTPAAQQRRIREAEERAARTIRDYVDNVAAISRYDSPEDTVDSDTPLGETLPAGIDPELAAELAGQLRAVIPRVGELLSLLDRRANDQT